MNAQTLDPKPITVDVQIVVRNIQAKGFDDAKLRAKVRTRNIRPEGLEFGYYAAREANGTYTVTLR